MSPFRRYPTLETVIVNCKSGESFRGVLWEDGRRYLRLRQVRMIAQGSQPVPVDGEVLVPRDNVSFIQVV
ncbi:MAG TPA: hypothetical protein VM537_32285 [Anaerolineae bacterium]|nr:hypothetical protein [Anaerolineae bacterium]